MTSHLVEGVLAGRRRAIARTISLVEDNGPEAKALLAALHPHTGQAHIVGVTGPPGSGKTFLARTWLSDNKNIHDISASPSTLHNPSNPVDGTVENLVKVYRRKGFARVVVQECLYRLRDMGMKKAYITGYSEAAVALYGSLGAVKRTEYFIYTYMG